MAILAKDPGLLDHAVSSCESAITWVFYGAHSKLGRTPDPLRRRAFHPVSLCSLHHQNYSMPSWPTPRPGTNSRLHTSPPVLLYYLSALIRMLPSFFPFLRAASLLKPYPTVSRNGPQGSKKNARPILMLEINHMVGIWYYYSSRSVMDINEFWSIPIAHCRGRY